jgi:hypothetical protein
MLRVIEIDPLSLERQTLTASRVVGEELAQMEVANLGRMFLERLPDRGQRARLLPDVTAPPRGVYLVA